MRETILLVLFDVPVGTRTLRRECSRMRSGLKKSGYVMFQKSVYYKLITNVSQCHTERNKVKRIVPSEGNVQFLPIPLRQFFKLTPLVGQPFDFMSLFNPLIEID